jgi:ubiquinone/menaquinone biosynthesis C-methylase UbiE
MTQVMNTQAVQAYYANSAERECQRLNTNEGAVEFAVNTHFLAAYLPNPARVLDIGGGPGRYALWLAERQHQVVLADLSPALLAIAQERVAADPNGERVEAIVETDARDLSQWADASFDAVVCLGPFYHLPETADREQVARELARVLRPGGVAFVALMPRTVFLRRSLIVPDERRHFAEPEFVRNLMQDGLFINDVPGRFNVGYGVRTEEVAPFFESFGFQTLKLAASEGLAFGLTDQLAEMAAQQPDAYQGALDVIIQTADDPSLLGMTGHLLYIATKAN